MPLHPNGGEPSENKSGYLNPELERLSGEISQLFREYFAIMAKFYAQAIEFNNRLQPIPASGIFKRKQIQMEWNKRVESVLQDLYRVFNLAEEKLKEIKRLPLTKEVEDKIFVLELTLTLANLNWNYAKENLVDLDKAVKYLEGYNKLL